MSHERPSAAAGQLNELQQRLQAHIGPSHVLQFELGGGGMSRVFVADEVALGRKVVIKVLNPALAATVSVARFQREIMVVAKLNHANIVPVLSAGELDGLPYFIMPFIEGESLRGRIVRGPLSLRETVAILKDVTRALAYAHSVGIIHRDIKPDNIFIAGTAAVVGDFGVAKALSAARDRGMIQSRATITGVGISLGTPQYMAPEQVAADPAADHRVDIYALGIVAYEMLAGSPPFFGRTPQALLAAQLTEYPPPLASRRYDVPKALSDLVMACLEKNPADRPRSATDVQRALENPESITGPVAVMPAVRRKRRWSTWKTAATASTVVLLIAALVTWSLWPQKEPNDTPSIVAAPQIIVSMPPATAIGAGSSDIALAVSSAIETTLMRDGIQINADSARIALLAPGQRRLLVRTTVQRVGDRARVQVRLFTTNPDSSIWANQLDFRPSDSFAAQDSIASGLSRAIRDASVRMLSS